MIRIAVPQIFENMEEATIGKWLVKEGATVASGDALCELITEKTTLDLPTEEPGTVVALLTPEKSVVPAGYIIALISNAGDQSVQDEALAAEKESAAQFNSGLLAKRGEAAPGAQESAPALHIPKIPVTTASPGGGSPAGAPAGAAAGAGASAGAGSAGSRVRATPAARRAARDANVNLDDVAARFPGKVLGEDDIKAFLAG